MAEQEPRNREQRTLTDHVMHDVRDDGDLRVHLGGLRGRNIFPKLIAPMVK